MWELPETTSDVRDVEHPVNAGARHLPGSFFQPCAGSVPQRNLRTDDGWI